MKRFMNRFITSMGKKPTIRDIASLAGVSVGTASNVLNQKPNVDETLKARVEAAIRELDYKVNIHARGMILRRSFNIGVVIPSLTDPFFPRFADSLEYEIEEKGSHVIIASSRNDAERERTVCDSLVAKQVDGIILTPCNDRNITYFNNLIDSGVPIVQLGRYYEEIAAPIVRADNFDAGYTATIRLIEMGHRKIAHLAADIRQSPDAQRRAGFEQAIVDSLPGSEPIVFEIGDPVTTAKMDACLSGMKGVSAVFADNDYLGLAFMKACKARGIRVPEDVSVLSIGSFFPPEIMLVELSTLSLDPQHMSSAAVQRLFEMIGGKGSQTTDSSGRPPESVVPLAFVSGETLKKA